MFWYLNIYLIYLYLKIYFCIFVFKNTRQQYANKNVFFIQKIISFEFSIHLEANYFLRFFMLTAIFFKSKVPIYDYLKS